MRIKHITLMSGPAGTFEIGHERDVSDKEGAALVAGGYAIEIRRRQPETATAPVGETAEQTAAQHLAAIGKASGKAGKASGKAGKASGKAAPASSKQDGASQQAPADPVAE